MANKNIVGLLGMAGFIVMADNWVVSPILPAMAADLEISLSQAGLLVTAYMIPFGLFQLVFGPLSDRFGKKQVIVFTMVLFTIATGLCALGLGLMDLALYRALTGVFAASVMPISVALLGDVFPMEERQKAIGTFVGLSFLGQGMAMAIGGVTAHFFNWRGVFAFYALLSLVPTLALVKSWRVLPSGANPNSRIFTPYLELLRARKSFFVYLLVFLEGFMIVGCFSYLGAYLAERHNLNYLAIGFIMTGFGVASVIGGRLSGRMVSHMSALKLLSLGFLMAALANLGLATFSESLAAMSFCVALAGLGFIFIHSVLVTRATEFAQTSRGTAMSLIAFCFMGAGGLGTALGSLLVREAGFATLYGAYGCGLLLVMLLAKPLFGDNAARSVHRGA